MTLHELKEWFERLLNDHENKDLVRHQGEREAVEIAATDINRRLEAANELRAQINNERGLYLTRELYDREHSALSQRVANLELSASRVAGSIWAMGATISILLSVVTIALHFWVK